MKKNTNSGALSPEKYIKTRVRTLDIKASYISENWKSSGLVTIIVSRQHKNSNVTHALFQVDLLAQGIINTFFEFNLEGSKYNNVINYYIKEQNLIKCSYDLVHHIIYGAHNFASKFKLKAPKDFALTQYVLEPSNYTSKEKFEIEFGEDGKPMVIVSAQDDKKKLISTLNSNIGVDNFKVIHIDDLAKEDHDHEHDHHHDHKHDHETAFDLPDFAKPLDILDKENIDNWTESDWQAFENGEMEVSAKTTLQIIDFMYNSHFVNNQINSNINTELLKLENLNISKIPVKENNFFASETEENRVKNIFLEVLESPSKKHVEYLEGELASNPNNPQLYSYLTNVNIKLNDIEKAEEWTERGYEKFPNYLFGQISYAQTLLQKGETERVLQVFGDNLDLKSLLPKRKEFHILEVVNFYAIMCLYFTTQKDIASANIYWEILKKLDEREEELVLLAENELMVEKARILKEA